MVSQALTTVRCVSHSTRFVPSTNGVEAAVHDLGGDGPLLVFVHATGFHGRCYLPVAEALHDRFHCFGVDLRGHGDARTPEGLPMVWTGMGDDLGAAIRAVAGDEPVYGVGHSMGGAAIVLAEVANPSTFRSTWLFEPILPPSSMAMPEGENGLAGSARRRREVFESLDAAFERYASRPPFSMVDPVALRAYVDYGFEPLDDGTVRLKCRGATEADVFENSKNGGFERLAEFAPPTAVVMSGDGGFPAQLASEVARLMPDGELVAFDDLTHFGPFQDPPRMADAIAGFFLTST